MFSGTLKKGCASFTIVLFGLAVLAGCTTDGRIDRAKTGALLGTATGAGIGYGLGKEKGMLVGAAAGAALFGAIGYAWDKYDQRQLARALENNPSGSTTGWVNPDTQTQYKVEPQPAHRDREGRTYRTAKVTSKDKKGNRRTQTVKAYRQGSGSWEVASVN